MTANSQRILLIEDDPGIVKVIQLNLRAVGFEVQHTSDGAEGLRRALSEPFVLVILDIGLPSDMDGFEVCRKIREENEFLPLLILSAKSEQLSRVHGLELGADDYLSKPFDVPELIARTRALLRRAGITAAKAFEESFAQIEIGELSIDLERRRVVRAGSLVELTAREFDLLAFLASRPGRPFTREQLLQEIFGYDTMGYELTINTFVRRLRVKLENNPAEPRYILTVRGVGYRFVENSELD